jgi:enamine deaminase RidA (YjgF/YER057c/UK114 family)
MSITRIGVGPRMSAAVVHGDTVYLAGQVADKTAGASVAEQTAEILGIIDSLLAQAKSSKQNLLMVNIYLPDIATFAEMNSVWDKWVPAGHTPARATIEAKLAAPQYKVEISAIAALNSSGN